MEKLCSRISELEKKIDTSPNLPNVNVEEITMEAVERINRSKNIIVKGIPEQVGDNNQRKAADHKVIADLVDVIIPRNEITPVEVIRLGKPDANKPRLIKVILPKPDDCKNILRNKHKLNNMAHKNIKITDDKTPNQLKHLNNLREELKNRISAGEINLTIKYIKGIPVIKSWSQSPNGL